MARRCGAKHICKSKCTKHHIPQPIFQVPVWKNGTPLWREVHFQVKMHKHHIPGDQFFKFRSGKMARHCGTKRIFKSKCTSTTFPATNFSSSDLEKWHATVARSAFSSQNVQSTSARDKCLMLRSGKMARQLKRLGPKGSTMECAAPEKRRAPSGHSSWTKLKQR